ncbi:unnamed protein product [Closterium sp. NIES-54]
MFQHIKDLVELDDSGPKGWKLLRDMIQPNTLPMVIVLEKELAALSMRPGDDVKPVFDKIKDTNARMAAAGSNVLQMQTSGHLSGYGSRFCKRTSAGATRVVVLPTKLLRGMELQEAAEEEGEGEAEAVGEALAEGEAEVTITRGMRALVEGGAPEWRERAGTARSYQQRQRQQQRQKQLQVQRRQHHLMGLWMQSRRCSSRSSHMVRCLLVWMRQLHGQRLHLGVLEGAVKEIGSCPTCLETKFTKFPFRSGTGPAKAPLTLVHMDVVGPTRAPSLSGSRYFLTIVDDHTRAVWVYPLKIKGEVAAAVLKEWMPRAQRESGHKVKVIRTDNGGEFIGADFEAVLKKKGIQHQLTVPYNPQQNGVAECFNRTLQEGARTLLGRAGLPDPFWVTALRQVALVKNRVLATVGDKHQQLTVSRDVKFLESLYYTEWKQQQQKLPTTPLIIEADEVQRPSRQVQVTVSDEEISGVTEDGGEPEVEEQQQQQQQQQQQDAPPRTQCPPDRPRRDVRPPNRLTYPSFGKSKVVRAGIVAE